jgi:hypothetical protein
MVSKCSHNGWHTGQGKDSFLPLDLSIEFGMLGHGRTAQGGFGQAFFSPGIAGFWRGNWLNIAVGPMGGQHPA